MGWHKPIIKPTGIVCDVQIGDKTFHDVTLKGEWEGLVKLEHPEGFMIGGKPGRKGDLFSSFFSADAHMFFEDVQIDAIRASNAMLQALKIEEPEIDKEATEEQEEKNDGKDNMEV